jgi:hypothetical protein
MEGPVDVDAVLPQITALLALSTLDKLVVLGLDGRISTQNWGCLLDRFSNLTRIVLTEWDIYGLYCTYAQQSALQAISGQLPVAESSQRAPPFRDLRSMKLEQFVGSDESIKMLEHICKQLWEAGTPLERLYVGSCHPAHGGIESLRPLVKKLIHKKHPNLESDEDF